MAKASSASISERDALSAVGRVLALAGAGFELQPMLDRVAEEAAALCSADLGFVFLLEGEMIHFVAGVGGSPEHWEFERAHPFPVDRATVAGGWSGRTVRSTSTTSRMTQPAASHGERPKAQSRRCPGPPGRSRMAGQRRAQPVYSTMYIPAPMSVR